LEGLQEVRVTSNDFTAEYGHGQSVIALTTKSGTNQYHGEANYTIRNEALNANTNSNNQLGLPRTVFKLNQLGGAVSGPILKLIPGYSNSSSYRTVGTGKFDPRRVVMQARVIF